MHRLVLFDLKMRKIFFPSLFGSGLELVPTFDRKEDLNGWPFSPGGRIKLDEDKRPSSSCSDVRLCQVGRVL